MMLVSGIIISRLLHSRISGHRESAVTVHIKASHLIASPTCSALLKFGFRGEKRLIFTLSRFRLLTRLLTEIRSLLTNQEKQSVDESCEWRGRIVNTLREKDSTRCSSLARRWAREGVL